MVLSRPLVLAATLVVLAGCQPAVTLVPGFAQPESAYWHAPSARWYVSNIAGNSGDKDGRGWISALDRDGRVVARVFVDGLQSPAGISGRGQQLFVADVDEVVTVDVPSATVVAHTPFADAQFLNDVAVAADGVVYVSDTFGNAVYRWVPGQLPEVLLRDDAMKGPNGLAVRDRTLWIGGIGSFTNLLDEAPLFTVDLDRPTLQAVGNIRGKFDGLAWVDDTLWLTDFRGRLMVLDESAHELSQQRWLTAWGLLSAADFGVTDDGGTFLVADLMGGKVALVQP